MEVNLGEIPFDLDFNPSNPLLAVALINGELHLYRYQADSQPQRVLQVSAHDEFCRAVRFVDSGRVVLTSSPDRSILATDVETGSAISRFEEAHKDSINRLVVLTETTIATGDDGGCIKVWDTRHHSCCNSFDAHQDYVSDMTFLSSTKQLFATSGDGSLSMCCLRENKVEARSNISKDELLSLVTMKDGKKVVCGTQNGPLLLYTCRRFMDCRDIFRAHPMSADALLKVDEDNLISGSKDGVIRLARILPITTTTTLKPLSHYSGVGYLDPLSPLRLLRNIIIQPLAKHSKYVERLGFSSEKKFLGSISHDQMLKLWDFEELLKVAQDKFNIWLAAAAADSDDSDDMDMESVKLPPFLSFSQAPDSSRKKERRGRAPNSSTANFFGRPVAE
ncbi:hypothetical protein KSP39_PZI014743 [Platanthera zijinensis]|uniref:WD repeat-containing protein 55 n=1 Tax=Platanthera zijinensis TaxID=2320716 RepID=A0AAP0G2T5_9ASPA